MTLTMADVAQTRAVSIQKEASTVSAIPASTVTDSTAWKTCLHVS